MRKRTFIAGLLSAGAGFPALAQTARPAQFTMKLSTSTSNDALTEWLGQFKTNIEARTQGRIQAQVYPSSQLGSIPRTIEGVAMGTIEVAMNAAGFYEGIEPRFAALSAPGLFDNYEHSNAVLRDPTIRTRMASFGASKNMEVLTALSVSGFGIVSHKPLARLDDFKGQKIRVPGSPIYMDTLKRLGASPVSMPLGEVLPALQNKTIDAVWAGPALFTAFKYHDIAKDMVEVPSTWAVVVAVVNRNFMKSLGPELAAMVREEAARTDASILGWAKQDIVKADALWTQNGGRHLRLSPGDAARFTQEAVAATKPLLERTAVLNEDYQALTATAQKLRGK